MTFGVFIGAFELGLIYSVLALGVFLSFRTLNTPDLTVDGSIVTGAAASAVLCTSGLHPVVALVASFIVGALAGVVTGLLSTKLKIQPLLAGILVMLGIYSINMRIMGGKANIALVQNETIYKIADRYLGEYSTLILNVVLLAIIIGILSLFLETRLGLAFRATGDNEDMVKACGINSDAMRIMGLSLSNGFVGLAGGMLAQYQSYSDIGMGTGMVVIGLASVIIGEVVFGHEPLLRRLIAVALGAVLYRLIIAAAIAYGMNPMDLKLISAVIVVVALAFGMMGERFSLKKKGGRVRG